MIDALPSALRSEAVMNAMVLHEHMHDAHGSHMFSPYMADETIARLYQFIVRRWRKEQK